MLTSRWDFRFERSNIIFHENKLDDVDLKSKRLDHGVGKNRGKILWFTADCTLTFLVSSTYLKSVDQVDTILVRFFATVNTFTLRYSFSRQHCKLILIEVVSISPHEFVLPFQIFPSVENVRTSLEGYKGRYLLCCIRNRNRS